MVHAKGDPANTILMADRGTPKTMRHMNGYGSHTFMWINAGDEKFGSNM